MQNPALGEERPQAPVCAEACPAGKQLDGKGPGSPGGHPVDHEPALCPCSKEGWCYPAWAAWGGAFASRWREVILPLVQHWWGLIWNAVSRSRLTSLSREMKVLEGVQQRAAKMVRGDWNGSSLRKGWETGTVQPNREEKVQGFSSMHMNTWREGVKQMEPRTFQWCPVTWTQAHTETFQRCYSPARCVWISIWCYGLLLKYIH